MYRECFSCNDILLVPRHSELESRSECDPSFENYSLPVIASPMDRVYSKELDEFLTSKNIMVMVHRYFKCYQDQLAAAYLPESSDYRYFAVGSLKNLEWIDGLLDSGIKHFCVDMAHGDSKPCVETTKYLVSKGAKVIAGNVATKSGFSRLQEAGAWGIRVGVGSGCFTSDMKIKTSNGYVPISEIKTGDEVFTHNNRLKNVIATIRYNINEDILNIDGVKCTPNHEFYTLHKKYENVVDEKNIHYYARWVRAEDLNINHHLLIQLG